VAGSPAWDKSPQVRWLAVSVIPYPSARRGTSQGQRDPDNREGSKVVISGTLRNPGTYGAAASARKGAVMSTIVNRLAPPGGKGQPCPGLEGGAIIWHDEHAQANPDAAVLRPLAGAPGRRREAARPPLGRPHAPPGCRRCRRPRRHRLPLAGTLPPGCVRPSPTPRGRAGRSTPRSRARKCAGTGTARCARPASWSGPPAAEPASGAAGSGRGVRSRAGGRGRRGTAGGAGRRATGRTAARASPAAAAACERGPLTGCERRPPYSAHEGAPNGRREGQTGGFSGVMWGRNTPENGRRVLRSATRAPSSQLT
jgi:hypothetical protein